jgi:hypothetical protein
MKRKLEYKITCRVFPIDIVQRVSRLHADLILTKLKVGENAAKPVDSAPRPIEDRT